ncbi:MAG: hypothetical protein ACI92G_000969, partial [Candidatus Pelagisphaera sp.]
WIHLFCIGCLGESFRVINGHLRLKARDGAFDEN